MFSLFLFVFFAAAFFTVDFTVQFQFNEVDAVATHNLSSGKDEVKFNKICPRKI